MCTPNTVWGTTGWASYKELQKMQDFWAICCSVYFVIIIGIWTSTARHSPCPQVSRCQTKTLYNGITAWTGGWWGARSSSPLGSILTLCFWKFEVHVQTVFTFHYGLEMFKLSINWIEIKMLCKFWSLTLFPLMGNGHLYVKATQGTDVCSGWYTTKPWRHC